MNQVRVSKLSEPAKVAQSVRYFLEKGENVQISALGMSAATLMKASALVNELCSHKLKLSFVPSMEYIEDSFGETRSACKMTICLVS